MIDFRPGEPVRKVNLENYFQKSELDNVIDVQVISYNIKLEGAPTVTPSTLFMITNSDSLTSDVQVTNGPKRRCFPMTLLPTLHDIVPGTTTFATDTVKSFFNAKQKRISPAMGKRTIPGTFSVALAVSNDSAYPFQLPSGNYEYDFPSCGVVDVAGDSTVVLAVTFDTSSRTFDRNTFGGRESVSRGYNSNV